MTGGPRDDLPSLIGDLLAITRTREARAAAHRRAIGLHDIAIAEPTARLDRLEPRADSAGSA